MTIDELFEHARVFAEANPGIGVMTVLITPTVEDGVEGDRLEYVSTPGVDVRGVSSAIISAEDDWERRTVRVQM